MRKLILASVMFISLNAFCQNKDERPFIISEQTHDTLEIKDASIRFIKIGDGVFSLTKVDSLTANTKFMSISDINVALSQLEDKMTVTQAKTFNVIFQAIVAQLAKDFYSKKEQPKK